jgi:hypothetical protein
MRHILGGFLGTSLFAFNAVQSVLSHLSPRVTAKGRKKQNQLFHTRPSATTNLPREQKETYYSRKTDQGLVEERERERERERQTETGKENAKIILSNFRMREVFSKEKRQHNQAEEMRKKRRRPASMRRKRRALLQNTGSLATAAATASTQGENRARRSSLHGIDVLIVHTRSHRRRQKREREREREREKGRLFFFGKQIGKIFGYFLFSSLNSTNFARFLENSPNF